MLTLDHIAVLGETLESAVARCEAALAVPMLPGGRHAAFATHNRLLGLGDGVYLEAIATDPAAPPPMHPRWFGLDGFSGPARLDKWICRVPDMAAALAALPEAGHPHQLERGALRWIMAVPRDGLLPFDGLFPALIEWQSPVPPGVSLPDEGRRLTALEVRHPRADALRDRLAPLLDKGPVRFIPDTRPGLTARIATPAGEGVLT